MKSFLQTKCVGSGMVVLLDDFCKAHGLTPPAHNKYNYNERVSFGNWLKKIKYIDKQYNQEGLGLDIGAMIQPAYIGIAAYICNSSETIEDYLVRSSKYKKIWYNYMPHTINYFETEISLSWTKPAYYQAGLLKKESAVSEEMQVAIYFTRLQQLTNNPEITFNHINIAIPRPKNIEKYEKFFKCAINFDSEQTALFLSKQALSTPIVFKDIILREILEKQADSLLIQMSQEDTFLETVNQKILQAINTKNTNIKYVAERMNMSIRALQNHLREHGVSFQKQLIDVRYHLAQQLLQDYSLNLSDIAFLLAYDEQTSFNKAFKLWSGLNPSQWRAKHFNKDLNIF